MRTARIWVILALLASPAAAGDGAPAPADPRQPLWFRLDVGTEPRRVVEGCLLRSGGADAAYDAATLDLDGDGTLETEQPFGETVHPRSKQKVRDCRLRVPFGEDRYLVEIEVLKSPVYARTLAAGRTTVNWSVQRGPLFVRFIDGPLQLFASVAEAREARPFRLGPPFSLSVKTGTKGMNPTVTVALVDANGAVLGGLFRDGKESRPEVKVLLGEEVKVTGTPGYS